MVGPIRRIVRMVCVLAAIVATGVVVVRTADQVRLVLFGGIGLVVSWLAESMHRARRLTAEVLATQHRFQEMYLREQAEAAMRISEERYRLLVEGTRDYAIFMLLCLSVNSMALWVSI